MSSLSNYLKKIIIFVNNMYDINLIIFFTRHRKAFRLLLMAADVLTPT